MAGNILEAMEQPFDLAITIMGLRSYAEAKRVVDNAKQENDLPDHPMIEQVLDIQVEIVREKMRDD